MHHRYYHISTRFWEQEDGESLKSLRELARLRRDGEITHSDFQRLKGHHR